MVVGPPLIVGMTIHAQTMDVMREVVVGVSQTMRCVMTGMSALHKMNVWMEVAARVHGWIVMMEIHVLRMPVMGLTDVPIWPRKGHVMMEISVLLMIYVWMGIVSPSL